MESYSFVKPEITLITREPGDILAVSSTSQFVPEKWLDFLKRTPIVVVRSDADFLDYTKLPSPTKRSDIWHRDIPFPVMALYKRKDMVRLAPTEFTLVNYARPELSKEISQLIQEEHIERCMYTKKGQALLLMWLNTSFKGLFPLHRRAFDDPRDKEELVYLGGIKTPSWILDLSDHEDQG